MELRSAILKAEVLKAIPRQVAELNKLLNLLSVFANLTNVDKDHHTITVKNSGNARKVLDLLGYKAQAENKKAGTLLSNSILEITLMESGNVGILQLEFLSKNRNHYKAARSKLLKTLERENLVSLTRVVKDANVVSLSRGKAKLVRSFFDANYKNSEIKLEKSSLRRKFYWIDGILVGLMLPKNINGVTEMAELWFDTYIYCSLSKD